MKNILIATSNANKVREYREMLEPLGYTVHDLSEITHEDPEETGTTFAENALIKARSAHKASSLAVIADDSGLEIKALDWQPGIYSARYLDSNDYNYKNKVILSKLENVKDRFARFVCAIALVEHDGKEHVFEGVMEGEIALKPAGENGFGYDPIFFLPDYGLTSAELLPEEKNAISHRGKATKQLLAYLKGIENDPE